VVGPPAAAPPQPLNADASLVRVIGVRRLTAIIINATVGAGIFVLPALAAGNLGPAAPLAYIVCGVAMTLVVTCFAAAGSRVPSTGGLYAYVETAFGPFVGSLVGVLYWASSTFSGASIAAALTDSIATAWPGVDRPTGRAGLVATLAAALAWVNVRGAAPGGRLIEVMTVMKLVPLAMLVGAGVWSVDPGTWFPVPEASSIGRTAILLIFAFLGIEVALVPSGEIRNPARTIPRAAFLALAFTTLLYVAVQAVAQNLLGSDLAGDSPVPLADAAGRLLGGVGRSVMLVGAAVSMLGYLSGDMLSTPRAIYALGRDGVLPGTFASIHPRFHTPWVAIATHALLFTALATTGSFTELVVITNVSTLLCYLLGAAAAYQLQRRGAAAAGPPFMLPFGPLIPLATAAVLVWLLAQANAREFAITGAVLIVPVLLYAARRFRIW
jgi:amino acid transporter